jgi:hypothetical protein
LALEQAAGFVRRTGSSFEEYLRLYEKERRKLLDQAGDRSVFTTLQINLNRLSPLAKVILRLVSFLNLDRIPVAVLLDNLNILESGVQELRRYTQSRRKKNWLLDLLFHPLWPAHGPLITQTDVRQALDELAIYSFLELRDEALSIHPLVRTVQVESAREGEGEEIWSRWAGWLTSRARAPVSKLIE